MCHLFCLFYAISKNAKEVPLIGALQAGPNGRFKLDVGRLSVGSNFECAN